MSETDGVPYAPKISYKCDDPDCCWNGCPHVSCRVCGHDWPCPDYRGAHTESEAAAQERYVKRVWHR